MKNNILKELSSLWASIVETHPKIDYDDILHRIEKIQLMVLGGEANGKEERQKRKTT